MRFSSTIAIGYVAIWTSVAHAQSPYAGMWEVTIETKTGAVSLPRAIRWWFQMENFRV
jgi:hypothetical protein